MTSTDYLQLVDDELEAIKANATTEQISKLDFKTFNPEKRAFCIYGQMTGDCQSPEAFELMHKSNTPEVFSNIIYPFGRLKDRNFNIVPKEAYEYYSRDFTALEHFIVNYQQYNKQILAYLKGTGDKPVLTV